MTQTSVSVHKKKLRGKLLQALKVFTDSQLNPQIYCELAWKDCCSLSAFNWDPLSSLAISGSPVNTWTIKTKCFNEINIRLISKVSFHFLTASAEHNRTLFLRNYFKKNVRRQSFVLKTDKTNTNLKRLCRWLSLRNFRSWKSVNQSVCSIYFLGIVCQ